VKLNEVQDTHHISCFIVSILEQTIARDTFTYTEASVKDQ